MKILQELFSVGMRLWEEDLSRAVRQEPRLFYPMKGGQEDGRNVPDRVRGGVSGRDPAAIGETDDRRDCA